jgi:RNA recognition motif-containing protein
MASTAGRKLFVGSLPNGIDESTLREEFSRFGLVEDVYIKPNCESGRQWAFVTMGAPDEAQSAKEQCDRILHVPGADRPCDVMVAKNQGMFGQAGETGGLDNGQYGGHAGCTGLPEQQFSNTAPTKIFVGSLPDGITDSALRAEYSKYGSVTDIFVKPGCEPGRQWAFVSFRQPEEATYAQEMTNGYLQFPGQDRGCEVTMARNQGMFGKDQIAAGPPRPGEAPIGGVTENMMVPKKVFVGSLPEFVTDSQLQAEFSKYGQVTDLHINTKPCEPGRNWAFITYASSDEANLAKVSADRILLFPGADKPCEVTLARHQGMFGQESITADGKPDWAAQASNAAVPRKIFVGSLPETTSDGDLRSEFSKYGQVVDVFVSTKPCEPGRNWAFITFASSDQAQYAKDCADRILFMPGAHKACEVMLAKNQGKFGQESLNTPAAVQTYHPPQAPHGASHHTPHHSSYPPPGPAGPHQPPPPEAPAPSHLTSWRIYKTAAGLPYYHNHRTQVTQWECPPDLQVPGQTSAYLPPSAPAKGGARYSPY